MVEETVRTAMVHQQQPPPAHPAPQGAVGTTRTPTNQRGRGAMRGRGQPRQTYHEQMEVVSARQRAYDNQFWQEGEPWHYCSSRKDLTYELVNYVRLTVNHRTWSNGMPVANADAIRNMIQAIQPQAKDDKITAELDEAADDFRATVAGIMVRHYYRKAEESQYKCRAYRPAIQAGCKLLATERVRRTFGHRTPDDLEKILELAIPERATSPPQQAREAADPRSPHEEVKRMRLDDATAPPS